MRIKKLSLAAAISIGMLTVGIPASMAADEAGLPAGSAAQTTTDQTMAQPTMTAPTGEQGITTQPVVPAQTSTAQESQQQPTAYGAGPAGTFKAYSTLNPAYGNAAGSTEIGTFNSQASNLSGAAGSMAAQGIYGYCAPCQPAGAAPVTPVVPSATPTTAPVAPITTPEETGGAAGINTSICPQGTVGAPAGGAAQVPTQPMMQEDSSRVTIQEQVATPQTSELEGGQSAATQSGMKCVDVPVTPPASTTGAAVPIIAPACVPSAGEATGGAAQVPTQCPAQPTNIEQRSADAPEGFEQPVNPGAITPMLAPTGAAAQTETCPVTPSTAAPSTTIVPATPVAPTGGAATVIPVQPGSYQTGQTIIPVAPATQMMAPQITPVVPAPTGGAATTVPMTPCPSTCPVAPQTSMIQPMSTAVAIPSNAQIIPAWQMTGAAANLTAPVGATCSNLGANAEYIERQVYAYPSMGGNTVIMPTDGQVAAFGGNINGFAVANPAGANVALAQNNLYTPGITTGAAANIGCPSGGAAPIQAISGAQVSRELLMNRPEAAPISIQTQSGMMLQRTVLVPIMTTTGAAAPVSNQFNDVPAGFWAGDDINRLASAGIISGYPDRTFKPNLPVSRAEFASILVSGLNLQNTQAFNQPIFKDVPANNWANNSIDKAYNRGLVSGYPNDTFRPNSSVSRAEALTTMAKALPTNTAPMSATEADQILSQYTDGSQVPTWAKISVAQSLKAGLLQGMPAANQINPTQNATRADIASMLSNLRQTLALEPAPQGAPTGAAASIQQQSITVPTLNVKFNSRITARASHIGDSFSATTLEPVTINGVVFPTGSTVNGKIVEVIRPEAAGSNQGALKVAFTDIAGGGNTAALPKEVLAAQVTQSNQPGLLARFVQFPFVLPGRIIGTVGRTIGGMTVIAGNASEQFLNSLGLASSDLAQGEFGAAGRTALGGTVAIVKSPIDLTRTALSGGVGVLNVSSDEVAYVASPDGSQVASINPNEQVAVAFGCQ